MNGPEEPGRPAPVATARAVLAGSTVAGTATSDLDVVVLRPGPLRPHRRALHYRSWPVELFVHTAASCRALVEADAAAGHAIAAKMLAGGVVLRGGSELEELRRDATDVVARGLAPPEPAELAARRYRLTNLVDDLTSAGSPTQAFFVAGQVASLATELLLVRRGEWRGAGKWLPRQLEWADPDASAALAAAVVALQAGDRAPLLRFAEEALEEHGGRLFDGHYEEQGR